MTPLKVPRPTAIARKHYSTRPRKKIESQRKYKVTERKTNTFARDMVFSCVFLILLMIVCYGDKNEHRYRMAKATNDGFSKLHKVRKAATRT